MTKKEFQKLYRKATKAPDFTIVRSGDGKHALVTHPRGIFVPWYDDNNILMLSAITYDREFYGSDFRVTEGLRDDPRTWQIESIR